MNNDNVWIDHRGNKWIKSVIIKKEQYLLNTIRKNWMSVTDEDICLAKKMVLDVFGENNEVRGMPCKDFLYMFDDKNHYFVNTDTNKEPLVYKYEGECDMSFSDNANFDDLMIFM
tara:strand:+ start:1955 stop:2299 length:345 start_codon:yes stop_codon:yes gene_type:complete